MWLIWETISNGVSNGSLEHLMLNDSINKDENPEVATCAQYLSLTTSSTFPSQGENFKS